MTSPFYYSCNKRKKTKKKTEIRWGTWSMHWWNDELFWFMCVSECQKNMKISVLVSHLNDRFLIVLRLAKFAKLFVWSTSPFWWWWRRCVCELTFSFSKLKDPAREPVFSNAAMSNIVVNSDGFWYMCDLIFISFIFQQRRIFQI